MTHTPDVNTPMPRLREWFIRLLLMGLGVGMAVAIALVISALFPFVRPDVVRFTVGLGDIFHVHPEWVVPADNMDEVLSTHRLIWDADGFRVPAMQADQYPIIALGDSYTDGVNVAKPWTDVLAQALDIPVRNLAFRGQGAVEQTEMLRRYKRDDGDQYVILGFFEGNDLSDVMTSDPDNITLPSDADNFTFEPVDFDTVTITEPRYPMQINLPNGEQHDVAFFEWYIWNLNHPYEAYQQSPALELSAQYWRTMRELSGDACFFIVYFPSKPHIYLPYLDSASQQSVIAFGVQLAEEEQSPPPTFETLLAYRSNLRDAVINRAQAENIPILDVTPILQDLVADGQLPYYAYDTHWNALGHAVVGDAIAQYIQTQPCAPHAQND